MPYGATTDASVLHRPDARRRDWSGVLVGIVIGVVATTSLRGDTAKPAEAIAVAEPTTPAIPRAAAAEPRYSPVLAARAPAFADTRAHRSARALALAAANGSSASYCVLPVECEPDVTYNLTAAYGWGAPDGYSRLIWGLNGTLSEDTVTHYDGVRAQGPTLRALANQIVQVELSNQYLTEGTSLHFHGIHQVNTPFFDGSDTIAQPQLPTMHSLRYKFRAWPPGTHWYHSHVGMQYVDGQRGLLIVEDPDDPYAEVIVEDEALMLSEWNHATANEMLMWDFAATATVDDAADDFTTHGDDDVGGDDIPLEKGGDFIGLHSVLVNGQAEWAGRGARYSVGVGANTTKRLRLVNAGWNLILWVTLECHEMLVVAADGRYVEPVRTAHLQMLPGERYDVLVFARGERAAHADAGLAAETRCRAPDGVRGAGATFRGFVSVQNRGLLRSFKFNEYGANEFGNFTAFDLVYTDGEPADAAVRRAKASALFSRAPYRQSVGSALDDDHADLDDASANTTGELAIDNNFTLRADRRFEPGPPETADRAITLVVSEWVQTSGQDHWRFNNVSYEMPTAPLLLTGGEYDVVAQGHGRKTYVVNVSYGEVVDLYLENHWFTADGEECHPIHFHGHNFWVVGNGKLTARGRKQRYEDLPAHALNVEDPPLKDTWPLAPNHWSVLRFVATNPGMWNFHCHFFLHNQFGLQLVFNVAPERQLRPPKWWFDAFNFGGVLCDPGEAD